MKKMKLLSLLLAILMLFNLAACGKTEAEPESEELPDFKAELTSTDLKYTLDELESMENDRTLLVNDPNVPALYKYFEGIVKIGVAFTSNQILDFEDPVTQGILKHYNIYVLGNEMKSDHCNPAPDTYNFDDADNFVKVAKPPAARCAATRSSGILRCLSGGSRPTRTTSPRFRTAITTAPSLPASSLSSESPPTSTRSFRDIRTTSSIGTSATKSLTAAESAPLPTTPTGPR